MTGLKQKYYSSSEDFHYKFQMGTYFSGMKKIKGAILLWSDKIKDFYWNYASKINISESKIQKLVSKIIEFYKNKHRQPTIYVTPFTKPKNLSNLIEQFGFNLQFKESWMFYEGLEPEVEVPESFTIKKVETKNEMKIFVDIFSQAYSGTLPEEPYGALPPEYGRVILESFTNKQDGKTTIHYIGMLNKEPVGIATLIYSNTYGSIYNIGTIPDKRRKGVGSILSLNCVSEAIKNNVKTIFLQTAQGSYDEKFYSKLGFSTEFVRDIFVLE